MPNSAKPVQRASLLLRVFASGLGADNVERIKSYIDSLYRNMGGNEPTFDDDELEQKQRTQTQAALSIGTMLAGTFTAQMLKERFQFTTVPALKIGQQVSGDYSGMVMQALEAAEQYKHEWGMRASNIAGAVLGGVQVATWAARILRGIRTAKTVTTLTTTTAVAANAIRTVNTLRTINTAKNIAQLAKATGGAIIAAVATELAMQGAYRLTSHLLSERAFRLGIRDAAVQLFDRDRILSDWQTYRAFLPGENGYRFFDSVLNQRMYNTKLADLGFDYEYMSGLTKSLSTSGAINRQNLAVYMGLSMALENVYGKDMSNTITGLSRITYNREQEVDAAREAFENFFVSLMGTGPIQGAYLNIVDELISFTEGYAQGTKFNLDGQTELAKISSFLFPSYNMMTTQPLQQMIMSIDQILMQGAMSQNPQANRLLYLSGIESGQAFQGVTENAENFNKFLLSLTSVTGIGVESFDARGSLSSDKLMLLHQYLTVSLGLDPSEVQSFIKPLARFVRGESAGEVHREFLVQEQESRLTAQADEDFPIISLHKEIMRNNRVLSDNIMQNAHLMADLDKLTFRAYQELIPAIRTGMGSITDILSKILEGKPLRDILDDLSLRANEITYFESNYAGGLYTPRYGDLPTTDARANYQGAPRKFFSSVFSNLARGNDFIITEAIGTSRIDQHGTTTTHYGIDVVVGESGSESSLYFPFRSGEVVYVGVGYTSQGEPNFGNYIVIKLDDTLAVTFAHLSEISPRLHVGQRLSLGHYLGTQGSTGKSTGAHVHMEFIRNGIMRGRHFSGQRIYDPEVIAAEFGKYLPTGFGMSDNYEIDTEDYYDYNELDNMYNSVPNSELHIEVEVPMHDKYDLARHIVSSLGRA